MVGFGEHPTHMLQMPRGFTLIELLVVVAIISVLSSVVLSALGTTRTNGIDVAIESNLTGARTQAELFYQSNNKSYETVCSNVVTPEGVKSIHAHVLAAANITGLAGFSIDHPAGGSATTAVCNDGPTGWAAQVPLKNSISQFFCVDSRGAGLTSTANLLSGALDYSC
jgi:prepilin-type N-terminal cleavage/methylation domain-containing protein